MLTNLSLQNIKSFNKEATLKIAPITLIYGPNSSGKSSLWKFFLALRSNLTQSSQTNFLNLVNSDFANIKTLSFDRSRKSTFTLNFSDKQDKENSTVFAFNFENPKPESDVKDLSQIKEMIEKKEILTQFSKEDKSDLLEGIEKIINQQKEEQKRLEQKLEEMTKTLEKKIEEIDEEKTPKFLRSEKRGIQWTNTENSKTKNNISENINNIKINELKIVQQNKTFINFNIIELTNPQNSNEGAYGAARTASRVVTQDQYRNLASELSKHYDKYFPNHKFKFDVKVKADKTLYNPDRDGQFNPTRVFDMVGPEGPKEIKYSQTKNNIRYLFLPTKVSRDKSFWTKYFDFLQFLKKRMIKNNSASKKDGKTDKEIFMQYIDESYYHQHMYYESQLGVNSDEIPEIRKTYDNTIRAMTGDIDEFIDIMSEDLETFVMTGSTFVPNQSFYGAEIFRILFDDITEKFLDQYIGEFDDKGNPLPITQDGQEFIDNIDKLIPISIIDQIKNLYRFNDEIKNYKKSVFDSPFRMGSVGANYGVSRFLFNSIHDDKEYKNKITKLLDKIELPFEIKSRLDDNGNIVLGFENKKITKTEDNSKEIPLEQSGNALKSILFLLGDALRSKKSVIILEEPENKLHPKIQGNLIELLAGLSVENNNRIIIETHSEHFILRIQKLIREKKIKLENVAINYVYLDEDGEGSKIDYMQLNENGKFINKWRHGFFNERLNEL
jgi:predicted ATPase